MPTCRIVVTCTGLVLLAAAVVRIPPATGGQAAVSLSLPGQEDLTFWANRNGLIEVDFEGEVGFGDMARLLMRRRANRDWFRSIRDRFVFRVQDLSELRTPDLFRVAVENDRLLWLNRPGKIVAGAGRVFNLPVVVINRTGRTGTVRVEAGRSRPCRSTCGPSAC